MVPKLADYSNTWNFQSSTDSVALARFGGAETNFFEEFSIHVAEPLKDTDAVNLQNETVFILRITFKFRLGMLGFESLAMFGRIQRPLKRNGLVGYYPLRKAVWETGGMVW